MKKLSKELQKRISEGDHGALMDGIEELFDMYESNPFQAGYECCMDDVCVHSLRLTEEIIKEFNIGTSTCGIPNLIADKDTLSKVIEEYFENNLKA